MVKALGRVDRLQPWFQTIDAGFFVSGFSNGKKYQGFELGKGTVAKSISLTVGKWITEPRLRLRLSSKKTWGQSLSLYLVSHAAWAH